MIDIDHHLRRIYDCKGRFANSGMSSGIETNCHFGFHRARFRGNLHLFRTRQKDERFRTAILVEIANRLADPFQSMAQGKNRAYRIAIRTHMAHHNKRIMVLKDLANFLKCRVLTH